MMSDCKFCGENYYGKCPHGIDINSAVGYVDTVGLESLTPSEMPLKIQQQAERIKTLESELQAMKEQVNTSRSAHKLQIEGFILLMQEESDLYDSFGDNGDGFRDWPLGAEILHSLRRDLSNLNCPTPITPPTK